MPPLGLPILGQTSGLRERPWRTLDELARGPSASPDEFPEGQASAPGGLGRREFLRILGASAAFAGLQACRPPRENVVGYVRQPTAVTPSVPASYATAASRQGFAVGLVVASREGRPIKIDGNRDHPASRGATDAILQASILDLYDPERATGFTRGGRALGKGSLLAEIAALAREHEAELGARLRFLVEPTSSPTLSDLRRRILARFPRARFDAWSPVADDAGRAGAAVAFGRPLDAVLSLAGADVLLALDSDLLAVDGEPLRQAREFASRREPGSMSRLYVAEAGFTVTGGAADHRFRMRSAEVLGFARAIASELSSRHGLATLAPLGAPPPAGREKAVRAVAADLASARGRSLVAVGPRQPPAVHALAAALNEALGNAGRTVSYFPTALLDADAGPGPIAALAREMESGQVDTLVVTAWNPLHTAPADIGLRRSFPGVKNTLVLAMRDDETFRAASWRIAASHPLESWGDLRSRDGTASIVQPLVAPLHETASEIELLAAFLEEGGMGDHRIVRDAWRARSGAGAPPRPAGGRLASANPPGTNAAVPADPFERRWEGWLAAGLVRGSAAAAETPRADVERVARAVGAVPSPGPGIEANFVPGYKLWDGRHLENAWLAELPDPVTKLAWDQAALLSPATARRLGLESGDVAELSLAGRTRTAPVLVVPGHCDEAVTLPLGHGQSVLGPVGKGGVGFDAYALRSSQAPWFAPGLELRRTGRRVDLAVAQGHFSMEGRSIALGLDLGELPGAAPELDLHRGSEPTLLRPVDYSKQEYRWGMSIDLSRCIGCAACTMACQAENNIPVVGRADVLRSREMHWLRVDRYHVGTPDEPRAISQPVMCVHCEAAPCEYVCPVNATVHSDEGLNEMVYNRCVGTRYCSNNCPYKVRRFNWIDYRGEMAPTLRMLMNPDVTVRARGVMEKCTYCVQRIERVRKEAREAGRKIGGDEVVTACQQACPAEAIVFGNLADPASAVSKRHADARRYDLLHELGTRPRTAYLVRLRNPNPDLA